MLAALPADVALSLGVVDGRNIWRADLAAAARLVLPVVEQLGSDRVHIAPSCSLLHLPVDADRETDLDGELRSWVSFAVQRLEEVAAVPPPLTAIMSSTPTSSPWRHHAPA